MPEVTFNLRYPGQYFDAETKLHYNYFRSYDSRTGRYTQGDPIGLDGGWNRFRYAEQNPLFFTDPDGLQALLERGGYNPNDVRGGFDRNGMSLVYNPRYYDPGAASKILLLGTFALATGPSGSMCTPAREALKAEVFAARTAPELKKILGWGNGLPGVQAAQVGLDAAALARIQASMSRAEIEALRDFYNAAAVASRGGPVAPARATYISEILRQMK